MLLQFYWRCVLTCWACVALPDGCGDVKGPYSLRCLVSAWLSAGCLEDGLQNPNKLTSAQLDEFDDMSLQ